MDDYRVELDVYHGPLDLLLHLIKRSEVDIYDIPIAAVTEQYLRYCQTLKALDINLAGEFLVMAATLMEIKSAMMAMTYAAESADPDAVDEATGEGSDADPRFELVKQLLAYKRFKDAARDLEQRREHFAARFPRKPAPFEAPRSETPQAVDLEDVGVWDLMEAFARLLEQVGGPPRVDLQYDDTPIELHETDIVDRLDREGDMSLQAMFTGRKPGEMLGLFLALLELMKQGKVRAKQEEQGGEIQLHLQPETEWVENQDYDQSPVRKYDPENPDHFDWPDEQTLRRYARRIERRKAGEKIEEDEQFAEDVAAIEQAEEAIIEPHEEPSAG